MKPILSALIALAAAAALVILPTVSKRNVTAVHAQSGCSNATLIGNYGFSFGGFQIQHGTQRSVPFYGAGLSMFDGKGNVSASFNFGLDGNISTNQPYTATYSVNSDCTGSVTATPGSGGDNFAFVIVGGGAEAVGVDISTGETLTVDFKKQ